MSLQGEYGSSKFGLSEIVTLVAATWTEVVLQTLVGGSPRPYPASAWVVESTGTIYIAQGNHSLTQGGVVVALPTNPATATSGRAAGHFKLLASAYWRVDAERIGENSLWLFGAAGAEVVTITEITKVPYDNT